MIRTHLQQARALLHRLEADRAALLAGDFRALAQYTGERERLLAIFEAAPDGAFAAEPELVDAIKDAAATNASLMKSSREGVEAARKMMRQASQLDTYTQDGLRLVLQAKSGTTQTRS